MAAPAVGEVDKSAERGILMKGRQVGTNQLQRSKRREGGASGDLDVMEAGSTA